MKKVMKQVSKDYSQTLIALDSLIGNTLNVQNKEKKTISNLKAMDRFLELTSIDPSVLNIIHIAGTKGKGSTSNFCETILRNSGLKTGVFTSPHLIDVRERIKINGIPVEKNLFIENFWSCWNQVEKDEMFPSMATYFRFLTLLAFQIFIKENVDVAIIEVGLGGRIDATNIIKNPVVCGITSLGYEHQQILGDTIEKIAFEKAGIMKPNVPCIVQPQKYKETYKVLIDHSKDVGCGLYKSPSDMTVFNEKLKLGVGGKHQELNVGLALCLSEYLLKKINLEKENNGKMKEIENFGNFVDKNILQVLEKTNFIGRSQVIQFKDNNLKFHIDGAHTNESLECCCDWFFDEKIPKIGDIKQPMEFKTEFDIIKFPILKEHWKNILVFNYTLPREPKQFLEKILSYNKFDLIIFCPLETGKASLFQNNEPTETEIQKMNELMKSMESLKPKTEYFQSPSLNHLLFWIFKQKNLNILFTGSLYLCGDVNRKFNLN
eukprot:gene9389-1600_t